MIPGLHVTALDAGCCGMAGAFGFEREHYDLSVQIANLELIPALKTEPDAIIAATGTSCRHQIRDLTGRIPLHPIQLIETALASNQKS
jgi:Fe-S oxidoreductase